MGVEVPSVDVDQVGPNVVRLKLTMIYFWISRNPNTFPRARACFSLPSLGAKSFPIPSPVWRALADQGISRVRNLSCPYDRAN